MLFRSNPDQRHHPSEGTTYYWLGGKFLEHDEDPQSDISLLEQGYLTAVPIAIGDLTHQGYLHASQERFSQIFSSLQPT